MSQLIIDKVIKDDKGIKMIDITDRSRCNALYKLPSGEIVKDTGLTGFMSVNRDIFMRSIHNIARNDKSISDRIMDVDTYISQGYNELSDDIDGIKLIKIIVKNM